MGDNLVYAVRGSTGFSLQKGVDKDNTSTLFQGTQTPKENPCRVFQFSNSGKYFAYCDCVMTVVIEVDTGRVVLSEDLKRTQGLYFSPKDTYLLTWEPYTIYGQKTSEDVQPERNMRVFTLSDGKLLTTLIAKQQSGWQPQFSEDEKLAMFRVGGELMVNKEDNLFDKCAFKGSFKHMESFQLSAAQGSCVAIFTPSVSGSAATVSVRTVDPKFSVINTRSFFNADKALMEWNSKGTALIIQATADVDKTNQSYYGTASLYLINVVTSDSCMIALSKNGPVYACRWNPNGREFAVCYGYMPAKVTLFNFRGDSIYEMVEGPRNDVHYNTFGTILLVCGFGNLATGRMEFWDTEKKKEIITIEVPNTTLFEWAPDGKHFLTATTTPRLRTDNVLRLWHYSGKLIQEIPYNPPEELWQAQFRPLPGQQEFKIEELTKQQKMAAGLLMKSSRPDHPLNNVPAGALKKAAAYVPPHLRHLVQSKPADEPAKVEETKKEEEKPVVPELTPTEKKIKALEKKLDEVSALKRRRAGGAALKPAQVQKVSQEATLLDQLRELRLQEA